VNIVILNWQRPLWEGDWEVVKRSGRDEPMWIAIHKCMEAMLGISLYSYLHLKLAKTLCLSYYLLCYLFNNIREEGKTGSAWRGQNRFLPWRVRRVEGRGKSWPKQCMNI
jgi:hypothetical protein